MLKTVIIDDEQSCTELLKNLLTEYCEDVEICGIAHNVEEGYRLITATEPDFVLLDIYMPPSNGFELLKKISDINFEVIFTTAFGDYAIEAIKQTPVDYLLKPIDPDELYTAVQKVKKKLLSRESPSNGSNKLLLHTDKSYLIISTHDIVRIESEEKRTIFTLKSKLMHKTYNSISEFENILRNRKFFRTHRSHIINMDEVREYIPEKNGGCVIMSDGKLIPLAIRRKDDFMLYFANRI